MKKTKIIFDILMTICFVSLMKVSFIGIQLHELVGIGIFFLFIIHKLLNYKWICGVINGFTNGKTTPKATFTFILDAIILVFVSFNVLSGILISQTVLTTIEVADTALWSNLHHFAAYSSLFAISIHIGLHWQMIMNMFKKMLGLKKPNPLRTATARIIVALIVFWGVKAILNPQVYTNITAPFETTTDNTQNTQASISATTVSQKLSDNAQIALLSTSTVSTTATPTLDDYLGNLVCKGCGKHCALTALRCNKGNSYKNSATAEYETLYGENSTDTQDNSASEGETIPETQTTPETSTVPDTSTNNDSITIPNTPTTQNETAQSSSDTVLPNEKETNPLDYVGLMGMVVAGTYYTITIPKKQKIANCISQF